MPHRVCIVNESLRVTGDESAQSDAITIKRSNCAESDWEAVTVINIHDVCSSQSHYHRHTR